MSRSCVEVLELLSERAHDPEIQAHLASCAQCRADVHVLEALAATRPEPDANRLAAFSLRVSAARVQQDERRQRIAPLRAALAAGALAATAVLLGVGLDRTLPSAASEFAERAAVSVEGADSTATVLSDSEVDAVLADYAGYSDLGAEEGQLQLAYLDWDEEG